MDDELTSDSLLRGAHKFAHSAMESHSKADEETFLLHAGVSIERLAKAALADKSPFLLVELNGKVETLLHLAGVRSTSKPRTVSASQAISRLRLIGALPQKDPDLDELIELRNGVAHLTASADEAFDGLAVFSRVTNHLLDHLEMDLAEYWGTWTNLIEITLSDLYKKVGRKVALRMEQARYRHADLIMGLPSDVLENYVVTRPQLSYGLQLRKDHPPTVLLPYECPACHHKAPLITGPPVRITKGQPGEAEPLFLVCFVCDFYVGVDEMAAAGIDPRLLLVDEHGERLLTDAEEYLWHTGSDGSESFDDENNGEDSDDG